MKLDVYHSYYFANHFRLNLLWFVYRFYPFLFDEFSSNFNYLLLCHKICGFVYNVIMKYFMMKVNFYVRMINDFNLRVRIYVIFRLVLDDGLLFLSITLRISSAGLFFAAEIVISRLGQLGIIHNISIHHS